MVRAYRNLGGKGGRDTATKRYRENYAKEYGRGGVAHLDQKNRKLSTDELESYLNQPRLYCFECGKDYQALGYHVSVMHLMSPKEYNIKHGLPENTPLMSKCVKEKISVGQSNAYANKSNEEKLRILQRLQEGRDLYDEQANKILDLICELCGTNFQKSQSYAWKAKQKGSCIKCDVCKRQHLKNISKKYRDKQRAKMNL